MDTRLSEVRHGRNFIRNGDLVRARPSRQGRHDGFLARFQYAGEDRGGMFYCVMELEPGGRSGPTRFLKPERIKRIASTKQRNRPKK